MQVGMVASANVSKGGKSLEYVIACCTSCFCRPACLQTAAAAAPLL